MIYLISGELCLFCPRHSSTYFARETLSLVECIGGNVLYSSLAWEGIHCIALYWMPFDFLAHKTRWMCEGKTNDIYWRTSTKASCPKRRSRSIVQIEGAKTYAKQTKPMNSISFSAINKTHISCCVEIYMNGRITCSAENVNYILFIGLVIVY